MRRRLPIAWILSLLLVFAQCGAVLHELGHLSHAGHASGVSVEGLQIADDGVCPTCEAFAQIANPAAGAGVDLTVCPPEVIPAPDPCYSIIGAATPTPRSRGPPQV